MVDLRETFDARGSLRQEGSLRQWTNGNLQALLEPTPQGHRLRLRTEKGDARAVFVAMLAYGVLHVPRWARLRRQQMEEIAARLSAQQPDEPQP